MTVNCVPDASGQILAGVQQGYRLGMGGGVTHGDAGPFPAKSGGGLIQPQAQSVLGCQAADVFAELDRLLGHVSARVSPSLASSP